MIIDHTPSAFGMGKSICYDKQEVYLYKTQGIRSGIEWHGLLEYGRPIWNKSCCLVWNWKEEWEGKGGNGNGVCRYEYSCICLGFWVEKLLKGFELYYCYLFGDR